MKLWRVKCQTCKKYKALESSPWCCCDQFPDDIPEKYFHTEIDEESKCPDYEYNPDWDID